MLTGQDRAMFAAIDRTVPGSVLTDYAEEMVNRHCEAERYRTSRRIATLLNIPLGMLAEVRDEFSWEDHDEEHEAASPDVIEGCTACRLQQIIDLVMIASLTPKEEG